MLVATAIVYARNVLHDTPFTPILLVSSAYFGVLVTGTVSWVWLTFAKWLDPFFTKVTHRQQPPFITISPHAAE
jgi:hypothetical protein